MAVDPLTLLAGAGGLEGLQTSSSAAATGGRATLASPFAVGTGATAGGAGGSSQTTLLVIGLAVLAVLILVTRR